jgi:hypothetical protein
VAMTKSSACANGDDDDGHGETFRLTDQLEYLRVEVYEELSIFLVAND